MIPREIGYYKGKNDQDRKLLNISCFAKATEKQDGWIITSYFEALDTKNNRLSSGTGTATVLLYPKKIVLK